MNRPNFKDCLYILVFFLVLAAEWACQQDKKTSDNQVVNKDSVSIPAVVEQPKVETTESLVAAIEILVKKGSMYSKVTPVEGESLEGGEATGLYQDNQLKKIILTLFGETGKMDIDFYFEQGKPIRFVSKRSFYDKPIYEEGSKVERTLTWKKDIPATAQPSTKAADPDDMIFRYDQASPVQLWAQKAYHLSALLEKTK